MVEMPTMDVDELQRRVRALSWYHTLDLGRGVVTPGAYDHRPYLHYYGLPDDLTGKTALDAGAASGFFAFELERRGARVTAIDLPEWQAHDFGPRYQPDLDERAAERYLREPILLAKEALGSDVVVRQMSVYDLSPEQLGRFDLVFCGSLLLHVTDPARALWCLRSVTAEQAIICTAIDPEPDPQPRALFAGHHRGDVWWQPNRACLEAMVHSAGFAAREWVSTFRLDHRDGQPGSWHGVIRAWSARPEGWLPAETVAKAEGKPDERAGLEALVADREAEIARLQRLVDGYQRGRVMRIMTAMQRGLRMLRGEEL